MSERHITHHCMFLHELHFLLKLHLTSFTYTTAPQITTTFTFIFPGNYMRFNEVLSLKIGSHFMAASVHLVFFYLDQNNKQIMVNCPSLFNVEALSVLFTCSNTLIYFSIYEFQARKWKFYVTSYVLCFSFSCNSKSFTRSCQRYLFSSEEI